MSSLFLRKKIFSLSILSIFLLVVLVSSVFSFPNIVAAVGAPGSDHAGGEAPSWYNGIVPECDGSVTDKSGGCGYQQFLTLISNVIQFLLYIAVPIAAISFFFAGFLYLTAAGNTGKIEEAHQIFWSALIGIIIMLSAWLLVNTIIKGLISVSDQKTFFQGIF